nr:retrovirus-related Pol polyprotein from transposon TNT 1-94 [Tanacetum cinerariifolium]
MSPSSEKKMMKMSRVPYASVVGSLMFAMIYTIAHAVGVVSRYMAKPGRGHWEAVKRILRYVKGTSDVALSFGDSDLVVTGYVDSDYAGDLDGSKSTTGYVFTLSGGTVSWVSKLQSFVAMLTTEAEYVVVEANKEAVWLKMLLKEFGYKQEKITLFCDNQSALYLARNPTFHSKTKHIRVQYHFVRERIEEGTVDMHKIHTDDNVADYLTKAINGDKFKWCRSSCGLAKTVEVTRRFSNVDIVHAELEATSISFKKISTSSSKLSRDQTSNPTSSTNTTPKGRIRRSSKQKVENSNFEENLPPVATMANNRTTGEMLRAPTEGCAEAIVVLMILAEQFELKHSLINMIASEQFFGLKKDNPHDHIRAARRWLEKEPPRSITTWDDLAWERYKDLLRACHHHGFTDQLDTFYNALNPADQDSLNAAVGGNLLEKSPQDALTIIENKSKVRNSRSKPISSQVKACDINSSSKIDKLTHAVNQQTSDVTTAMTAMLKQLQANPPPAPVKAVEETCVTCGGAHPYYQCLAAGGNTFPEFMDNIQGYVSAATCNYNQGNPGYRPQDVANQMRPTGFAQPNVQNNQNQNRFGPPQGFNGGNNFNQEQPYQATAQPNQNFHLSELEKIKRINEVSIKAMHNQIDMVKNELRNEMKTSIQTSLSNQTNEIKNMMASLLQMNTASTSRSGSLPSNTVANPKGELKAITTRSGIVTDGPTVHIPPKSVTPEVSERVEETYTNPDLAEYTIKVPPPPVQKYKPSSQRDFVVDKRDSPPSNIPYPSRMLKQKQQEKDEKMLKYLLSNKEKLQKLANTPLNENYSAVILKKLPEKLRDPRKFLIPCGFSELNCKALADLELGLPELILTCMTLELANRAICTPAGIARDVFVPVGKFTFPADFIVVDYESDPRVPLILGRPFLRTACALIDVHGEEMILRDGDERLTLNMKHGTASYSNNPQRESVNLINIFKVSSEDFLEVSVSNQPSGNPTFSLHQELTSSEVNHEIYDSEGCTVLSEKLPDIDSINDIHPYFDDNPLSGSTTYSSNSLLEEFTDELALITYPPDYDDNLQFDIESDLKEIEFLLCQGKDSSLQDSIDQTDLANLDDYFVDPIPEMFTDKHTSDYSSPPIFDVYDDDFLEVESDVDNVYEDSVDDLPSTNNEDKVFNPGILIHEKPVTIITRVVQDKNVAISNASLVFEDFDPLFCEPLFFKDVPKSKMLLLFSSENKEKNFKPGIYTSGKVKEKQEKDKMETKPDKNEKRGKAQQCRSPITVKKAEKKKKIQSQRTKDANPKSEAIPLDSVNIFWRTLDVSWSTALEHEDIQYDDELHIFKEMFNKQSNARKKSLLRRLGLQDVRSVGNYEFRSVTVALGLFEDQWPRIRSDLVRELEANHQNYQYIFGTTGYKKIYKTVRFTGKWMEMPNTRLIIASAYNRVVISLANGENVGALREGCPLPMTHPLWRTYRSDIASRWE